MTPFSNLDIVCTTWFTDDPLIAGTTIVQAVHLDELRSTIGTVRSFAGLPRRPMPTRRE